MPDPRQQDHSLGNGGLIFGKYITAYDEVWSAEVLNWSKRVAKWRLIKLFNSQVYVTSSFRKSGQDVSGAIVKPAKRSNHFVGHAIDMNVVDRKGWCNSRCLRYSLNQRSDVQCFIEKIQKDPDLRWGGDFSTPDVVHIDDSINWLKPSVYDQLYNTLQKHC